MKSGFLQPDGISSHIVCNLKGTCLPRFHERASASRRVSGPPDSPMAASTSPIRASCSPMGSTRLSFACANSPKSGCHQKVGFPPEPAKFSPRVPGAEVLKNGIENKKFGVFCLKKVKRSGFMEKKIVENLKWKTKSLVKKKKCPYFVLW